MNEITDPKNLSLYNLLSILDGKASALLSFNGIFLAVLSVWLGYIPLNYMHLVLDIVFLLLLFSCYTLLRVIWLVWAPADQSGSPKELEIERKRRTTLYLRSWKLSAFSILLVLLMSFVHTIGTALVATDYCGPPCQSLFGKDGHLANVDTSH